MTRMNVNFKKLRGQCYDGAASMSGGIGSCVVTHILQEEPRALYTHSYGHSLNIALFRYYYKVYFNEKCIGYCA